MTSRWTQDLAPERVDHQVESVTVGVPAGGLEIANRSVSKLAHNTSHPTFYPTR